VNKNQKKKQFIPELLSPDELKMIRWLLAIERVWWDRWREDPHNHWVFRGEDGYWQEEIIPEHNIKSTNLAIDMRGYYYDDGFGNTREIGWVPAERIVSWERGVVPSAINWFAERFFGLSLFGYGLYFYYQCRTNLLVVGGRGSGKTKQVAISAAIWCSLHPGENWIHYGYTLEQAKVAYYAILEHGSERIPKAGEPLEEAPLSWFEVFVNPKGTRESPLPRIRFNSWDPYDPGNTLEFKPLNPQLGATRTRSGNCARCSIDECTTDIADEGVIAIAEATVRGVNSYRLRQLPAHQRQQAQKLLVMANRLEKEAKDDDPDKVAQYQAILKELASYRVTRHLGRIRTGNSGPFSWIQRRSALARTQPTLQAFYRIPFTENPYLTAADKASLLANYPEPEQARVELYALEPMGLGSWFLASKVRACTSKELSELNEANRHLHDYDYHAWLGHVTQWSLPYKPGYKYVIGADPGTGKVPDRDSWNVQVWRFRYEEPIAKLVSWAWGNIGRATGSWQPFLNTLQLAKSRYLVQPDDVIIGVAGPELGIIEAAYGSGNQVSTFVLSQQSKFLAANYARELVGNGLVSWPEDLTDFSIQLSNWDPDDRELNQDAVMAFFAASYKLYYYLHGFIPTTTARPSVAPEVEEHRPYYDTVSPYYLIARRFNRRRAVRYR